MEPRRGFIVENKMISVRPGTLMERKIAGASVSGCVNHLEIKSWPY